MIRPPGFRGVAFTSAGQGDQRHDPAARARVAAVLGIAEHWASVGQVHGGRVLEGVEAGPAGPADAVFTTIRRLPVAVFTADCKAVAVEAEEAVGVAHAGWRGVLAGVVENLCISVAAAGGTLMRAAIGPGIGACCFEVGPEVAARFPSDLTTTSWGSVGVDLAGAIVGRLDGLEVWRSDVCTRCDPRFFSHRRDATDSRMAGIAWLP